MENKRERRSRPTKQTIEDNCDDIDLIRKQNVSLKRDNELKSKLIAILENIKDKLEMKVFLLANNNCECDDRNGDNLVFSDNDTQLAKLYEQYIKINKLNTNRLKSGRRIDQINIEPQVILNVDYNSDYCDNCDNIESNNNFTYKQNELNASDINKQLSRDSSTGLPSNGFVPVINSSKLISVKRRRRTKCEAIAATNGDQSPKYICDWDKCGKTFKNSDNLTKHQRIHTNDKRFKCDWPKCDYECVHSYSLTFHMRLHTGEKPYVCDWPDCDYRCAHSYSMVFHKRKHTGEKKYVCDCGYSARMLTDFKRHQVRHTGIKPSVKPEISGTGFKCDLIGCGKWCKSLGYMKTHIRKKHQIGD